MLSRLQITAVLALAALARTLKTRSGPLPGDISIEQAVQRAVLHRSRLKWVLDRISAVTWPRPAMIGVGIAATVLLLRRRWLEALEVVACALLSNDSGFHLSRWVRRPRPSGHGIQVERRITRTYGFPSGHVVHSTAVFGFLLVLSHELRAHLGTPITWLLRLAVTPPLLLIGISRVNSGEHWPSDVLAGRLLGAAWLATFVRIHQLGRSDIIKTGRLRSL